MGSGEVFIGADVGSRAGRSRVAVDIAGCIGWCCDLIDGRRCRSPQVQVTIGTVDEQRKWLILEVVEQGCRPATVPKPVARQVVDQFDSGEGKTP